MAPLQRVLLAGWVWGFPVRVRGRRLPRSHLQTFDGTPIAVLRLCREAVKSGLPLRHRGLAYLSLGKAGDLPQLAVRADDQFENLWRECFFGVPVAEVNQLLVARRAHRFRTGLALVIPMR